MHLKQSGNILKLSNKVAGKNVFLVIWAITLKLVCINIIHQRYNIGPTCVTMTKENQKRPCFYLLAHLVRELILDPDSKSFNPLLMHFNLP